MRVLELADLIRRRADGPGRVMAALAGPPGAGKSTVAAELVGHLGPGAKVVPMDGFHYDDRVLNQRGLQDRKGAPDTFDVAGFRHLIARLRVEDEVAIPLFDRTLEIARAGADIVTAMDRVLVVEGNYLLLNEAPWSGLAPLFDLTVWLDVPEAELEQRLMARWSEHGKSIEAARAWVTNNDMPNVRRVIKGSRAADVTLRQG